LEDETKADGIEENGEEDDDGDKDAVPEISAQDLVNYRLIMIRLITTSITAQ